MVPRFVASLTFVGPVNLGVRPKHSRCLLFRHHPSTRASKVDQLRGTDLEKKVKEATSNENWGAPNSLLREIARASFD